MNTSEKEITSKIVDHFESHASERFKRSLTESETLEIEKAVNQAKVVYNNNQTPDSAIKKALTKTKKAIVASENELVNLLSINEIKFHMLKNHSSKIPTMDTLEASYLVQCLLAELNSALLSYESTSTKGAKSIHRVLAVNELFMCWVTVFGEEPGVTHNPYSDNNGLTGDFLDAACVLIECLSGNRPSYESIKNWMKQIKVVTHAARDRVEEDFTYLVKKND